MHRSFTLSTLFIFAALFLFPFLAPNPVHAEANSRMAALESSVNAALEILKNPELANLENREARRQQLRDTLYPQFDFSRMAQGATGRKWRKFSSDQKERFTTLFKQLLERTYLGMIERYQGEEVSFVKEVEQSKSVVRVDSIIYSKGQKYDMSYRMGKTGDQWKVFDVIIEGVSVIANYRAQFKQLLRKSRPDIEGMLAKLEEKVSKPEAE
ncbi:MAG: ABC transporter substrate-binding protein [Magnetococcales bacterium]|nr:ABC transporter substrate-binding protein [Magnetococcales bacterium]